MTQLSFRRICDFCGVATDAPLAEGERPRLFVAAAHADICEACVDLAAKIVADRRAGVPLDEDEPEDAA